MRTTIEIADDLLLRAKETARKEKKTLRALFEEVLREALTNRPRRKARFKLKDASVGGNGLQPGVDPARLLDFAYEDRIA